MIGLNLKVCVGNDNAFKARDMLRGKMKSPQKSEGVRCVQCSAGEEQIFIIILKGCYHMSHCFVGRSRLGYTCLTYHMCKRIIYIYIYRVSQEECARLRESVPYVKVYRYNPKHLYPKLNGYGDNGQRKVRSSCGSTYCTFSADALHVLCACC